MNKQKRFTQFCGIDVAKNKHVACIINRDGEVVAKSRSFHNTADGYQALLTWLKDAGTPQKVVVAMEATGHYWHSLHDFLVRHRYEVAVLNPIQTAQQARKGIRKTKTDKIDARHIATLVKNNEHRPAVVPGELGMTCRLLSRQRYRLTAQISKLKQLMWAKLHPVWPEFEQLFKVPFGVTGRKVLHAAPIPKDVQALGLQALSELMRKASRGKLGAEHAQRVWHAAQNSIGMQRGLEGSRIGIQCLLAQLEFLMDLREQLEDEIQRVSTQLPAYILTLPGCNPVHAVSLYGETDPFQTYQKPSQLVAFAGLDMVVFQTGEFEAPRKRITQRGSPYLRRTLWWMAFRTLQQDGDLRNFWLRKRREGVHHLAAVTATARKLCHVIWRIMTDQRDYLQKPPGNKS